MSTPLLWVCLALAAALPVTYGVTAAKWAQRVEVAYGKGYEAGKAASSAATVDAAGKTAAAFREADEEISIPDDRAAIIALCKRSASCIERGTFK